MSEKPVDSQHRPKLTIVHEQYAITRELACPAVLRYSVIDQVSSLRCFRINENARLGWQS
jgi:hypothetical protein